MIRTSSMLMDHIDTPQFPLDTPEFFPSLAFPSANDWQPAISELLKLTELNDNWDYEGAEAPKHEAVQIAGNIFEQLISNDSLPPSRILPTFDGGIALEWQINGTYREVEITPSGAVEWMTRHQDGTYTHFYQHMAPSGRPSSISDDSDSVTISDDSDSVIAADTWFEFREVAA